MEDTLIMDAVINKYFGFAAVTAKVNTRLTAEGVDKLVDFTGGVGGAPEILFRA